MVALERLGVCLIRIKNVSYIVIDLFELNCFEKLVVRVEAFIVFV